MADDFLAVCRNSAEPVEEATASLADSLTQVVKVEKPHVLTYLRLRSDKSVRELTELLKDYNACQTPRPESRVAQGTLTPRPQSRAAHAQDPEEGVFPARPGSSAAQRATVPLPGTAQRASTPIPGTAARASTPLPGTTQRATTPLLGAPRGATPLPGAPLVVNLENPEGAAAMAVAAAAEPPAAPTLASNLSPNRGAVDVAARRERLEAPPISSYRQGFTGCWLGGEAARRRKQEAKVGNSAFEKVWRPEYLEGLARWKASGAGEKRVKALAEKCRGLYSVWNRVTGPKTHYRTSFGPKPKGGGAAKVTKDRNRSEVPIGSIYSIDPWELEASEVRVKELMTKLREAKASQESMKNHMHRAKDVKKLVTYPPAASSLRESTEVKACFSICARATGRSEYRTKFQY